MSISTVRDDYVTAIKAALNISQVYVHDGRFDASELKRWAHTVPSAVISLLGMSSVSASECLVHQTAVNLNWGVFLLAGDRIVNNKQVKRGDAALTMVEAILPIIKPVDSWTKDITSRISGLRADSLYSGDLDSNGVAIWAVTWDQVYIIQTPE